MGKSDKKTGKRPSKLKGPASNSSRDTIELVHLEDVQEKWTHATRKQKLQRHFKRFWLCYVVGIVVLLAIVLPLLFLVIIPALAQLIVNKTDLPIYHASLKAVSNNQVIIGLSTSLTVPGGLTVKLDPIDLYLYNSETPGFHPYTMVSLDSQSVTGKTDIQVQEKAVNIGNRTEINLFLTKMLYSKTTDISVKANTTAHIGPLHFNIKLEKTVNVAALNELQGFSLDDARIKLPADQDDTNLLGSLTLPNWSDLTIGLGNLTFNAWAGDLVIGTASVFDVVLPPGNSTLPFRGELFLDVVMDNLLEILGTQGEAITEGVLEVVISGNKTIIDGEHITYLENVLNPARIVSRIPILQLLMGVLGSLRDGSLLLDGIGDVLGDGIGSLLDGIFRGDGEEGGDGVLSDVVGDIFGDGDERGILGDLLDKLDMQNGAAKRRLIRAVLEAG